VITTCLQIGTPSCKLNS